MTKRDGIGIDKRLKALQEYAEWLREPRLQTEALSIRERRFRSRRDLLMFGVGSVAAAAAGYALLPPGSLGKSGTPSAFSESMRHAVANKAIAFDDAVDRDLFSSHRMARIYTKSQITPLKNNYAGVTPDPGYLSSWKLLVEGLAGGSKMIDLPTLLSSFSIRDQITRLVCVEGWTAVAWWSGFPVSQLLERYPPMPGARWARLESAVNLDGAGNPDPYFVSIDMPTLLHPQTLLATHFNGEPLGVEHGAPLRLVSPMKLGLKNIKAMTRIVFSERQPDDYWQQRGYSGIDGL